MPCQNCNNQAITFSYTYPKGCSGSTQSSCDCTYTGNNLACSGINKNDSLNTLVEKIDAQICSIQGDYSSYNFNCLTTWWGESITTEAEFVDAITDYACTLKSDFDSFVETTFANYQTAVDARFDAIEVPGITCSTASVTNTDTLQQVLTKYCTKFGSIDTALALSSVTWDQCFTVPVAPTTIAGGFNLLIDQICSLQTDVQPLPTFDNTGNCLEGTSTDTLVETIDAIINRLCYTPIWNTGDDDVYYGCVPKNNVGGGENQLQNVVNNLLSATSDLIENKVVTWSGDFVVEQVDPENACLGLSVSLATPLNQDRKVAVNATDDTPGELIDKLAAGDNITLTVIGSNPNKQLEISADVDHKVLASNTDDTPGFLVDKVSGDTDEGITLTPTYNPTSKKVDFNLDVDMDTLVNSILTKISSDTTLRGVFCSIVNTCIPQACAQYTVSNSSGSTKQITYSGCDGSNVGPIFLGDGDSITFCAQLDSVIATGCTVINDGECTTTSTTTIAPLTNNIYIQNDGITNIISDITFNGVTLTFDTGTYPIDGDSDSRYANVATGYYNVIVTFSAGTDLKYVQVTDSNGDIQCLDVSGAGTYAFPVSVYANNITQVFIEVSPGGCAP